jgi:hypothetical protein
MDKTIDKLNIGSKLDPIDERSNDETKEDYIFDKNKADTPTKS